MGQAVDHRGFQHLVALRSQFDQQCVPVGEVVARSRVGHPQRPRQTAQGDGLGATALQHLAGCDQQLTAEVAMVVPLRHGSRSHTNPHPNLTPTRSLPHCYLVTVK